MGVGRKEAAHPGEIPERAPALEMFTVLEGK